MLPRFSFTNSISILMNLRHPPVEGPPDLRRRAAYTEDGVPFAAPSGDNDRDTSRQRSLRRFRRGTSGGGSMAPNQVMTVLVVEDDDVLRQWMITALRRRHHEVHSRARTAYARDRRLSKRRATRCRDHRHLHAGCGRAGGDAHPQSANFPDLPVVAVSGGVAPPRRGLSPARAAVRRGSAHCPSRSTSADPAAGDRVRRREGSRRGCWMPNRPVGTDGPSAQRSAIVERTRHRGPECGHGRLAGRPFLTALATPPPGPSASSGSGALVRMVTKIPRRRSDGCRWCGRSRPWWPRRSSPPPGPERSPAHRRRPSWQPTTRPLSPSTTSFIMVFSSRPDSVCFIGRKVER